MEREEATTVHIEHAGIRAKERELADLVELGLTPLLWGPPGTGKTRTTDRLAGAYERVISLTVYPGTDDTVVEARVLAGDRTPWERGPVAQAFESARHRKTLLRISELQWGSPALFQHLASVLEPARRLHLPSGETLRAPLDVVLETNDLLRLPPYLVDRCVVMAFEPWDASRLAELATRHGLARPEAERVAQAVETHNRRCDPDEQLSARALHKYAVLRARFSPMRAVELAFRGRRGEVPEALRDALSAVLG